MPTWHRTRDDLTVCGSCATAQPTGSDVAIFRTGGVRCALCAHGMGFDRPADVPTAGPVAAPSPAALRTALADRFGPARLPQRALEFDPDPDTRKDPTDAADREPHQRPDHDPARQPSPVGR